MESDRPPHGTRVWIGRYLGGRHLVVRHFRGDLLAGSPPERRMTSAGRVCFSLLIPQTVAFLVTSTTPDTDEGAAEAMLPPWHQGDEWLELWPRQLDHLTWPQDVPIITENEIDRLSVGYEALPGGPRAL